jgi:hypothetical protein
MKRWILSVLGVLLLLTPVKVRCGSPDAACAMPPAAGKTLSSITMNMNLWL